ncbi:MAG: metallophosphoesterase family protein [Ardenticatenaceae bacterium]
MKTIFLSWFTIVGVFFVAVGVYVYGGGGISTPVNGQAAPVRSGREGAIHFAVVGDFGRAGEAAAAVARMVKSWQPDFIITTGDNNYQSGAAETIDANIGQYYSEYIYPYKGAYAASTPPNRFFPALGNHDWHTNEAQPYLDYFPINSSAANTGSSGSERYYDFVQGPVHFFVLNSDPRAITPIQEQAAWLQAQLSASKAKWQIVYFHHAPYSSGWHGDDPHMQLPFHTWGVDAVLAGHEHSYERLMRDDLLYLVNGLGGKSIRRFHLIPVEGSQVRYCDDYGAMWVEASDTSLTFQFYSITNGGALIDSYRMTTK